MHSTMKINFFVVLK